MHMCILCFVFWIVFLRSFLLQYFDNVGWVIRPVKTVGHITYIVLVQTLNHAQSINAICVRCITLVLDLTLFRTVHRL